MKPRCPYCTLPAKLVDSAVVYRGKSFGPIWLCQKYPECDSFVGVHKGTTNPLGRLANAELRKAKRAAHDCFDQLWHYKVERGYSKKAARGAGYRWLAEKLGIPQNECHIGMFDVRECQRVVKLCKPYLRATE